MLGWRARIGNINPSAGETFAYEFYQMVPKGVVLVLTSTNLKQLTVAELERTLGEFDQAAERLAWEKVDFIMVGGAPLIALKGIGSDKAISDRIMAATKIPTISVFTAVVEALRTLSVKNVVVATPYRDDVNERHKRFLEASGFIVTSIKGIQVERERPADTANLPLHASYQLAKEAFLEAPDSDGILIPCARWRSALNIEKLEKDLKVPVVTNTQAIIWAALKGVHIGEVNPGFGRLFETL